MAAPQTKRHATLVSDFAASAQAASSASLDFSEGSVFLALGEATAGLGLWLQKLYIWALSVTRLRTSFGVWVDTFIAPFGMERLGPASAGGLVNFTRFTPTGTIVIPVGAQVSTSDNTQVFAVVAVPANPAYSADAGGYLLLAGALTVGVPVSAVTPGSAGNVAAQTITKMRSNVSGIATVINTVAMSGGQDAEQDAAVKGRFPLYLKSLFRATRGALAYAVSALGQGLTTSFMEFQHPDGTADNAFNTVFVDDGSGTPTPELVAQAAAAVNDYRAFGVRVGVFPASRIGATVQLIVQVDPAYSQQDVVAAIVAAITLYINGLGLGQTLRYTRLIEIAYDASPGVINITGLTLNGATADLVPTPGQTIKTDGVIPNPAS